MMNVKLASRPMSLTQALTTAVFSLGLSGGVTVAAVEGVWT